MRFQTPETPLRICHVILFSLVSSVAACGFGTDEADTTGDRATQRSAPAPVADSRGEEQTERARALGPFLEQHWQLPIPVQGAPPKDFTEIEGMLDPAACGACHPAQFADWSESHHARAFSPGISGQLIEGALAAPFEIRQCQSCHAPLGEQQPFDAAGHPEPAFDSGLRDRGIACAACHVRWHRRFGPPRRPSLPPAAGPAIHGGFEERPEYAESRFCAACHQFFDDDGVNGKPIENTYAEWERSPQAASGRSCQSCHMPDRKHQWRGIHDVEMVRSGVATDLVAIDLAGDTLRAALVLESRDVGHAFPTYVTPRVTLSVWQVGPDRKPLLETRVTAVIGREVDLAAGTEIFDTRVLPGDSVKLDYALPRHADAVALVGNVVIDPDFHYRGVFDYLLATLTDARARGLIQEAKQRVADSSYVLSEFRQLLPASSISDALRPPR